jgi:hypothetical protein
MSKILNNITVGSKLLFKPEYGKEEEEVVTVESIQSSSLSFPIVISFGENSIGRLAFNYEGKQCNVCKQELFYIKE